MADKKLYDLGLVCGRFGHLHLGHVSLIESSMNLCSKTLVLVGSAQESNTLRNPFNVNTRISVIRKAFPDNSNLIIHGLDDLTNEFDFSVDWGGYVMHNVEAICGKPADLMVYGNDESRNKWFSKKNLSNISELILSRNTFPISATILRGLLVIDDKKSWQEMTPKAIYSMYEMLRNELLNVPIYDQIYKEMNSKTIDDFMNVYKIYEQKDKEEKLSKI